MDRKTSLESMARVLELERTHWQRNSATEMGTEASSPVLTRAPVVALSREAGTNGGGIARSLAKRLGWPVYDRELIQLIANEGELRTKLVESVDERQTGWLRECLEAFFLSQPTLSSIAYVRRLREVLLALATHGDCVIVGRGAAQILPTGSTFRVRLVSPLPERIATIERRFGISHVEASDWIERTDRERSLFVKEFFQSDATALPGYDLVLNTSRFSIDDCGEVIHLALKCWRKGGQVPASTHPPEASVAC